MSELAAGVIGAILGAVLTKLLDWWSSQAWLETTFAKPCAKDRTPFCRDLTDNSGKGYWIRLKVRNDGPAPARGVEGKLVEIRDSGCRNPRKDWDPCVLRWGEYQGWSFTDTSSKSSPYKRKPDTVSSATTRQVEPIVISRGEHEYLNIMVSREGVFDFKSVVANPVARGFCFKKEPGNYELVVFLHADNAAPREARLRVAPGESYKQIQTEFEELPPQATWLERAGHRVWSTLICKKRDDQTQG